ncbi:MAG: hypothetical protein LBG74_06755, partial [Spirochaetaceae bacterium]|nr:hypothetical protein [Spirochaetaceae bacterium]
KVTYQLNYENRGEYNTENAPAYITFPVDTVVLPQKPVRPGWSFVRWDTMPSGSGTQFAGKDVGSNVTVYAIWEVEQTQTSVSPAEDGGGKYRITVPVTGFYRIELWGAQGCDVEIFNGKGYGGRGAYVKGNIRLEEGETLYLYKGGAGQTADGAFNGGGAGGIGQEATQKGGGGGATDVRVIDTEGAEGLASRIMVAAGGGGACDARWTTGNGQTGPNIRWNGGGGGGDSYKDGGHNFSGGKGEGVSAGNGGGQMYGGSSGGGTIICNGFFGTGGAFDKTVAENGGGGGGGWFGGGAAGQIGTNGGGGGGSSYVSGYPGCVATSTPDGYTVKTGATDVERSASWTNKMFSHMVMRSGYDEMPSPEGDVETGHSGPGYARVIYLGETDIL